MIRGSDVAVSLVIILPGCGGRYWTRRQTELVGALEIKSFLPFA